MISSSLPSKPSHVHLLALFTIYWTLTIFLELAVPSEVTGNGNTDSCEISYLVSWKLIRVLWKIPICTQICWAISPASSFAFIFFLNNMILSTSGWPLNSKYHWRWLGTWISWLYLTSVDIKNVCHHVRHAMWQLLKLFLS